MRKILAATLISLMFVSTVDAKPHHWYRDWKNWAALGLSVGSSVAASRAVAGCRNRADFSKCDGHYGPYGAIQGVRTGFSITMGTLSVVGHEKGFKEWIIPALGATAYNTYTAVQQSRVPASKEK